MPDISKINALDIGSVANVDGLAKASILDIDGVAIPAAVSPPLDTYTGASAAYSIRLLRTAYTGAAMRVRRDTAGGTGDDDEADIAFDTSLTNPTISLDSAISNASAGVTATTLGQFLNVGTVPPYNGGLAFSDPDNLVNTASCFVDTWYDQSGNANDAEQTAFGSQPQIHNGTVNTDLIKENGKPAVDFDSSNLDISISQTASNYAAAIVERRPSNQTGWLFDSTSGRLILDSRTNSLYFDGAFAGSYINSTSQDLVFLSLVSPSSGAGYVNGAAHATGLSYTQKALGGTTKLGSANTGGVNVLGTIQEFVLWPLNQTDNRTAIETNINTYFSIY